MAHQAAYGIRAPLLYSSDLVQGRILIALMAYMDRQSLRLNQTKCQSLLSGIGCE